jgi:hypothetical protein
MLLVLCAVAWYLGANVWHAILLGGAITVVLRAAALVSEPEELGFSWRPDRRSRARGGRSDVTNLAMSVRPRWGRTGVTADRRVVEIARRRLALRHLDLKNPDHRAQIQQLVGSRAYRSLTREDYRGMRLHSLQRCLDALDSLERLDDR